MPPVLLIGWRAHHADIRQNFHFSRLSRFPQATSGINMFECFIRNRFHIDPDYEFQPKQDYLHDIRLLKHHLKCHRKMMAFLLQH